MGKPAFRYMGKKHSPRFLATVEQSRAVIQECDIDEFSSMLNDGGDDVDWTRVGRYLGNATGTRQTFKGYISMTFM